jgi:hypothetical protein
MSPQRWTTTPAATILFPNPSRPRRRFLVVTRRLGGRRFLGLGLWGLVEMIPPPVMWWSCLYCFMSGVFLGWFIFRPFRK